MAHHVQHALDCKAVEDDVHPTFVLTIQHLPLTESVNVTMGERCDACGGRIVYLSKRMRSETWRGRWRAHLGVWLATWEHRADLWDAGRDHPS